METITIETYKFHELSEEVKEKAIDDFRNAISEIPWQYEIINSLKAIFKASGISLTDYSLGLDRGFIKFDIGEPGKLSGARALAWLENNLFYKLRIKNTLENRKNAVKYGNGYAIGSIKPCPLTGICFDEAYITALVSDIKAGSTLHDAYAGLAGACQKLLESECLNSVSAENIGETLSINEHSFLASGEMYS